MTVKPRSIAVLAPSAGPDRVSEVNKIRLWLSVSLLLGALTVLGFAPFYLFPVPLVTLALLCHLWRNSATPFHAALLGFSFGWCRLQHYLELIVMLQPVGIIAVTSVFRSTSGLHVRCLPGLRAKRA